MLLRNFQFVIVTGTVRERAVLADVTPVFKRWAIIFRPLYHFFFAGVSVRTEEEKKGA